MRLLTTSAVLTLLAILNPSKAFQSYTQNSTTIVAYPVPAGVDIATSYEVKVRAPRGTWQNVTTYRPTLTEVNITTGSSVKYGSSMAYFDFSGTVEISVTYLKGSVDEAVIRPYSYGINFKQAGRTVTFQLMKPVNIVLQVNGDVFDCLHLFTNSPVTDAPAPDDPNVIYYGPGYHSSSQSISVPSGKTLYLAGGAVLSAPSIQLTNVTNAAVRGHGVLINTQSSSIAVTFSSNVVIEGLIGINFLVRSYQSSDVEIRNWRSFSAVQYGDGIDLFCSRNILIDSVFIRSSDDSFAVYNHRDQWYGDSTNITLQNSSLWADVAHPINVGTHGNTENPETVDSLVIRNIDILDHREKQMLYQGAIALNPGDSNLIQNVIIEDIRVENFRIGQLLNFRVMFNEKYNTSPGRGIQNVVIRNLNYTGTNAGTSIFTGYDGEHLISNITFQNLTINGQSVNDKMRKPSWYLTTDFVPIYANEHVKNMTFLP